MNQASMTQYITDTFAGVDSVVASGDSFFFYDPPGGQLPPNRRFPFATIVTKDYGDFDCASQLNRPGVFRLNIGVSKETYRSLFGPRKRPRLYVRCTGGALGWSPHPRCGPSGPGWPRLRSSHRTRRRRTRLRANAL